MNAKNVYQKAIEKWGVNAQVDMVQEECLELALAIRKYRREPNEKRFEEFIDEVADVTIMVNQMENVEGWKELIDERIAFKLNRLNDRITNNQF